MWGLHMLAPLNGMYSLHLFVLLIALAEQIAPGVHVLGRFLVPCARSHFKSCSNTISDTVQYCSVSIIRLCPVLI